MRQEAAHGILPCEFTASGCRRDRHLNPAGNEKHAALFPHSSYRKGDRLVDSNFSPALRFRGSIPVHFERAEPL